MKYFESVDFKNLNETYLTKSVVIDNEKVNVNLNFDKTKLSDEELTKLKSFLNQLSKTIKVNAIDLKKEFESSEENTVKEYISHHLAEIPKDELNKLIDSNNKIRSEEEKLFEKIKLTRIGIYPQDHEQYAIFDYTFGEKYTQYLLVIITDKDGKIIEIIIES